MATKHDDDVVGSVITLFKAQGFVNPLNLKAHRHIIEGLVIYIADREKVIFNHAFELGIQSERSRAEIARKPGDKGKGGKP